MTAAPMTDEQRRQAFESIRVQRYQFGWNDAAAGRPQASQDLAYLLGYADATREGYPRTC